jgi:hypothetical protein
LKWPGDPIHQIPRLGISWLAFARDFDIQTRDDRVDFTLRPFVVWRRAGTLRSTLHSGGGPPRFRWGPDRFGLDALDHFNFL